MNSHDAPSGTLAHLADVHRGWCNYCKGNVEWCRAAPPGGCSLRDYENALASVSETETPLEGAERLTAPGHAGDEYTEARSPVGAAPHPSQPAAEGTPRTDAVCTPQSLAAILNASKLECALLNLARTLERELAEAKANYQFMVDRAADEKLDGYRELGARAASAESRAEAAESRLSAAVLAEREACAEIADEHHSSDSRNMAECVADAIRARTGVPNDR